MDYNVSQVIEEYLKVQLNVFTVDDFMKFMKVSGQKMSKENAFDILYSSTNVFALVNNKFVTRAGVFTDNLFSFKPTKEECKKGSIVLGHRCMPFVNPDVSSDNIKLYSNKKQIKSHPESITLNTAMDLFALYGEGYVFPNVIGDKANEKVPLSAIKYNLPKEIMLTSWPISKIEGGKNFCYGDRIICKVTDWRNNVVSVKVQKCTNEELSVSKADIEREEWYSIFEDSLLKSFDRSGPVSSIEEQLANLYLEKQQYLCTENCGSAEEFLQHTKKIGFVSYGVESRIWKTNEEIPYIGEWNKNFSSENLLSEMTMSFSPQIIDSYLENSIYESQISKKKESVESVMNKIFPQSLTITSEEKKLILLNIEKRNDILRENYNQFSDYTIAPVRQRILVLFSEITSLLCQIGCSGLDLRKFPQQEFIVITQLFSHLLHLIEELENVYIRDQIPVADISLSLEGMEEMFEEIKETLTQSLDYNIYRNFEVIK
jgi:hypothetical protein